MPNYTLRAVGTQASWTHSSSGSPGLPSGWQVGDRHFLLAIARSSGLTLSISGWTEVASRTVFGTTKLFTRIAQSGDTAPTVQFSGSGTPPCIARIVGFYGDVYTDSSTVTEGTPAYGGASDGSLSHASLSMSTANCLVFRIGRKDKSNTSNGLTFGTTSGWSTLFQSAPNGTANAVIMEYQQQTTATTINAASFPLSAGSYETSNNNSIVVAFKTSGASAVKKLKVLVHESAADAAGISGAVFEAPTEGDITGEKIGEFVDQQFESSAALEDGKAVLKVPVSEFGGDSLTTSDTPVAVVRNAQFTTGAVSCTVIEE